MRLVSVIAWVAVGGTVSCSTAACGGSGFGGLVPSGEDGGGDAAESPASEDAADTAERDAAADVSSAGDARADSRTPVDDDAGPTTCPSSDPVNASDLPWAPPTPTQAGKCTEQDLTNFQDWLKTNPSATNAQFMQYINTSAGADCYGCIFTDASNATWGPIPVSGGKLVTINVGACFALASGNTGCGKAIQNEFDCEFVACAECADDTSFQSCQKKAQTGACKPFVQAIQSGCSGVSATVDDVCGSFLDSIRIQCVTANVFDGG